MKKKNATNKSWQNFIPNHFFKASSFNTVIGQLVGKSVNDNAVTDLASEAWTHWYEQSSEQLETLAALGDHLLYLVMLHYAVHKALQFNCLPGPWILLMISSAQSTGTDIACKGRQALIRLTFVFRQLNKLPSAVVLLAHQSNAERSPRTWPLSQADELCTAPGNMASGKVYLSFGLIADVQYADVENGTNFAKTRRRYYRPALGSLQRAISLWKHLHNDLAFVLQLGDLIDGVNIRRNGKDASAAALKTALAPFKQLACPVYHMIGNHDLYNLTRTECLSSELHFSNLPRAEGVEGALYFSVEVHPRLRLVVLDSYDIGVLGFKDCPDHPHYLEAEDILEQNNPNTEKNSAVGLKGVNKRFVAYNGGIGKQQLRWLDAQLTEADSKRQNVLICGHVQLNPVVTEDTTSGTCLVWNYTEVQEVIYSHNCVVGCVMGHDHDGSHSIDSEGIHHLVLNGVIETPPDSDAYATGFLCDQTLEIHGSGVVPCVSFPLKYFVDSESIETQRNGCS